MVLRLLAVNSAGLDSLCWWVNINTILVHKLMEATKYVGRSTLFINLFGSNIGTLVKRIMNTFKIPALARARV